MINNRYPDLDVFSKSIGIPAKNLVEAFEIEKVFHKQILEEESFEKRQKMYEDVYNTVYTIYGKKKTDIQQGKNPQDNIVRLFRKELEGKSILDLGCGEGYFLDSVSRQLNHKSLVGLDVAIPPLSKHHKNIEFITSSIIKFDLNRQFDVGFSNQVLEHIAPSDLPVHLASVRASIRNGGLFIINLPNRLFGPSDVTRIIDYSNTGKTGAQGTHLNESTYRELIPVLRQNGFQDFKTVLPIPKLRFMLDGFRMQPRLLQTVENSPFILKILRSIKFRGRCIAGFGIHLICKMR